VKALGFGVLSVLVISVGVGSGWIAARCCQADESNRPCTPYFRIKVVDEETGRGIPLVKLTTTNQAMYWTDSAGVVAFCEPDLLDKRVWFSLESYGYSYPKDGLGYRGVSVQAKPGGSAIVKMHRENIAQRLYRITGAGIYRDSLLLGDDVPPTQDPSPSPVMGQDSVATTVYKGKVFWIWGDTGIAGFALGNFKVTAATSELPSNGGLDPDVGVYLKYFRLPEGRVKPMANMEHRGPIWFGQIRVGLDEAGKERLFAPYSKIAPGPGMRSEERGWCVFDDEAEDFKFVCTMEDFARANRGDRDWHEHAGLRWRWKNTQDPATDKQIQQLVETGDIVPGKLWDQLTDVNTGERIAQHGGTACWNEYRQRWVNVRLQGYGKSFLGEVWYFEGDTPQGPWVYGQKIVTHFLAEKNAYTFYGVYQHPEFDKERGREIFFEGTYTTFIASVPFPTPYYNYNQIMYKLQLGDPRLFLPVPLYQVEGDIPTHRTRANLPDPNAKRKIAWFAPDRPREGTIPVYQHLDRQKRTEILSVDGPSGPQASVAFYALPAAAENLPEGTLKVTVPLNEFVHPATGKRIYTIEETLGDASYRKSPQPVCRVWKKPVRPESSAAPAN
jgi:hypothetical protein